MGIFSKKGIIKSDGVARSIRQSDLVDRIAKVKVKEKSKQKFNTGENEPSSSFFSSQMLQTAYIRLKTRLSEVGAKFDPELYVAGVTIALAYVQNESGIFSDFAIFMLSCFGDSIKPHLLSFYTGLCNAPDMVASTLTSYEECLKEYKILMQVTV